MRKVLKKTQVSEEVVLKENQKVQLADGSWVETTKGDFIEEAEDKKKDVDVQEIIKDFINTKWSDKKEQGKAIALYTGLIYSDDAKAKKFVKDLDALTNSMKAADYK